MSDDRVEVLVEKAKAGDRLAIEQIVRRIQQPIYNLAVRMLWDPEDARDATQESLIRIVTRLESFRGESRFMTWAYRVSARPTHTHGGPRPFSLFGIDRWTLARPLLVGAVHGLAGSGALTARVVTTLPSTVTRLGYLTLFGVGTIVGMAALSGLLGWPIARMGADRVFARTVSLAVGSVSTALGLFWGYPFIEGLL